MPPLPAIADSIYEPFLTAGFQRRRIPIAAPSDDPTLRLEIHALTYLPTHAETTLVLLHGHPQSSVIWHRFAPALLRAMSPLERERTRIVIPDLRGHGLSDAPVVERTESGHYKSEGSRGRYSGRQMARDIVEVVKAVGSTEKFWVMAHDRGARVAHRLAVDFPDLVHKMILLDIGPTVDMYNTTDVRFATAYWHWFFLIQPHPFPERMILAEPTAYLAKMTGRFASTDPSDALHPRPIMASYNAALSMPAYVEACCEDYRQSAPGGIDFEHDEADRAQGKKIQAPLRVIWGRRGVIEGVWGREKVLEMWKGVATSVDAGSKSIDAGHYIPEEAPNDLVRELLQFFGF